MSRTYQTILGCDFTSAPSRRKPITCILCTFAESQLSPKICFSLTDWSSFEQMLRREGPWLAAFDFPFGQPLKLLAGLGWPTSWTDYVQHASSLGKEGFIATLDSYRASRAVGDKLHLRETDCRAGAISPMMLHRVPVGRMFLVGAPRLLSSRVSVLPCRPLPTDRIAVEGYPALVVRTLLGKCSYKSDERQRQSIQQRQVRQEIVKLLSSPGLEQAYGVRVAMSNEIAKQLIEDPMGDRLDAMLCAVQGAWSWMQRECGYGIPAHHEVEGWIADPGVLPGASETII